LGVIKDPLNVCAEVGLPVDVRLCQSVPNFKGLQFLTSKSRPPTSSLIPFVLHGAM